MSELLWKQGSDGIWEAEIISGCFCIEEQDGHWFAWFSWDNTELDITAGLAYELDDWDSLEDAQTVCAEYCPMLLLTDQREKNEMIWLQAVSDIEIADDGELAREIARVIRPSEQSNFDLNALYDEILKRAPMGEWEFELMFQRLTRYLGPDVNERMARAFIASPAFFDTFGALG